MIRVMIVDDHPLVRKGLIAVIQEASDCAVVGEASNGDEALIKARSGDPDIVILDIGLPGKGGLEVLKQLQIERPNVHVLILSNYPESQYAIRCLQSGARGYLMKTSAPNELMKAIRKLMQGGRFISSKLAEILADDVGHDKDKAPHERLSDREFQVLCLLGQGKTTGQVALIFSIGVSTVNKYRAQVLRKMRMRTTAQLIRYVLDNNLMESAE